ncbi:hypothetical protein A8O28_23200 [Enterobacteriaceae bacterium CCUG 67584]|nr:hypothetical protein [Enterobacteriaceae bacterium CCUG 67584]
MDFKYNTASVQDIALHLYDGEFAYIQHLMARVNIDQYANKIKSFAHCFEAWNNAHLIGLVAVYLNIEEKRGYITNVTVLPGWHSCGIASRLLQACINYVDDAGVKEIGLEVNTKSIRAQKLYLKHGFIYTDETADSFKMVRIAL